MAKLLINTSVLTEHAERNLQNEIVTKDKLKFIFCISNELLINNESLHFQFFLEIPKETFATSEKAKKACLSWCKTEFPKDFSKRKNWNFFSIPSLYGTDIELQDNIDEYKPIEVNVSLSDELNETANNAIKYIEKLKTTFGDAKSQLNNFAFYCTAFNFNQSIGEARQLFYTIENILACSADVGGSKPSDIRSALSDYQDLAGRKNENNPNYQSLLRNLQRIVSMLSFPRCWHQKPVSYNS
jgi:hypothetical protein